MLTHTEEDIFNFVQDNANIKVPMDGPQWRFWAQDFEDEHGRPKTIVFWKQHHGLCDGISVTMLMLAVSAEYDRSYFIKGEDATFWQIVAIRLSVIFMLPKLLLMTLLQRADDNVLTRRKPNMTGILNCHCSKKFEFSQIKDLSKKVGHTINDVVATSLTTGLSHILKKLGDESTDVQMVIPANIRFKFYPTREHVRLENKFSAIPLRVPLTPDMASSYGKIAAATLPVKKSIGFVYASYALSGFFGKVLPRIVPRKFLDIASSNFTLAYSNLPGPVKPFFFEQGGKRLQQDWT
jgi:NRPS condensation-like uncharacterized protein